jgi:hypothetical protein
VEAALNCFLGIVAASLGLAEVSAWHPQPTLPIRDLVIASETVVVAGPAEPSVPGRFKTLKILMGTALKEGEVFEIDDAAAYEFSVSPEKGASVPRPIHMAEALFFLQSKKGEGRTARFPLTPWGLRIVTAYGGVCYPEERFNPKGYTLRPYREELRWAELVRKTEADAAEVHRIRSLKKIEDPHRRNLALLDWIERHGREFDGWGFGHDPSVSDGEEPTRGWGSLEEDVFTWVFESHIPRDCWEAVKLYSQLHDGWNPWLQTPAFGTRAGRKLLLSVVVDDNALDANRARALELLALSGTLWSPPTWLRLQGASEPLDVTEQILLIDRITPLLKNTYPRIRRAAGEAILEMSSPQQDSLKSFRTRRALSALTAAYQREPPGCTRDALAEAVGVIAGPKRWEELTGNAHGVVALLHPGCRQGAEASCTVVAVQAKAKIQDDPMFVFERLDDKQKVVEKQEIGLDHVKGNYGWWLSERGQDFSEHFEFSMADFTPGVWRITVKGFAGDEKAPWASEPCLLRLAPPTPDHGNLDLKKPRIVFNP